MLSNDVKCNFVVQAFINQRKQLAKSCSDALLQRDKLHFACFKFIWITKNRQVHAKAQALKHKKPTSHHQCQKLPSFYFFFSALYYYVTGKYHIAVISLKKTKQQIQLCLITEHSTLFARKFHITVSYHLSSRFTSDWT